MKIYYFLLCIAPGISCAMDRQITEKNWRFSDETRRMSQFYMENSDEFDEVRPNKKRKITFMTPKSPKIDTPSKSSESFEFDPDDIDPRYIKMNAEGQKIFTFDEDKEKRAAIEVYEELQQKDAHKFVCECDNKTSVTTQTAHKHFQTNKHQLFLQESEYADQYCANAEELQEKIREHNEKYKAKLYFHCACNKPILVFQKNALEKHFKSLAHVQIIQKARNYFSKQQDR